MWLPSEHAMKRVILIAIVLGAIYWLSTYPPQDTHTSDKRSSTSQMPATQSRPLPAPDAQTVSPAGSVADAYSRRLENVRVEDQGMVVKVLADDAQGSQHQRFLVRVNSGTTILIAHNIDLAPRVAGLQQGDRIRFAGEYVWSEKGGVVHWTHRDPAGRHAAGWIELNGQRYR
jgi:hypothetical protein